MDDSQIQVLKFGQAVDTLGKKNEPLSIVGLAVKAFSIEQLRLVDEQHGQVRLLLESPNLGLQLRLAKRDLQLNAAWPDIVEFLADAAVQRRDEGDGVPGRSLSLGQCRPNAQPRPGANPYQTDLFFLFPFSLSSFSLKLKFLPKSNSV